MPQTRIAIKQGGETFRFLRIKTSDDGSLVVLTDRNNRPSKGAMTRQESGSWVAIPDATDKLVPSARFTIHTSGRVHRYHGGKRSATTYIEPLYALPQACAIGWISVPGLRRLDRAKVTDAADVAGYLEIPETFVGRLTFLIEIAPGRVGPAGFGFALHYEIYSLIVSVSALPVEIPDDLCDHFIYLSAPGTAEPKKISPELAELRFHQTLLGGRPPIYRSIDGSYEILASTPMRIPPKLEIDFDRSDLQLEQITFSGARNQPTHKVRFWIRDKGGRSKIEDLRSNIIRVALDAEIY